MPRNTFEAWATPVDAPKLSEIADHTFVTCDNIHFGCWGSSDTSKPGVSRVAEGSGNKALCKATKYTGPMDSAWLGIYAVNGVCHQSANLFLYAVDSTSLPLNEERPHGVLASHALYAVYGTVTPGTLVSAPAYFSKWLTTVYAQAYTRCLFCTEEPQKLTEDMVFEGIEEGSLEYKICRNNYGDIPSGFSAETMVVSDMQIVIDHILQIPQHPILKTHTEIITEKNNLLKRYGLTEAEIGVSTKSMAASDIKSLVDSLNGLAVDFQDNLKSQIGTEAYITLNGDEKYYLPVNPAIAVEAMSDLTKY